jgi:hypothetical protein
MSINVFKPRETDDIKLRLKLSKDPCYVGEPITLDVIMYLRQEIRQVNFMVPILEREDAFYFFDPEIVQKPDKKYYRLELTGGPVIAEQGSARLDGNTYSTITFSKILIPKRSGTFSMDPATVSCEVLTGYRQSRRSFGNDFFGKVFDDDFFTGARGVYKKVVAPSNAPRLTIKEVPSEGKPAGFAGHIGTYKISADAAPLEVSVGDPITLTVTLNGPEYLEHISLPPLAEQSALTRDFKIPAERASGAIHGREKIFTQTIRALRPDVTEIPPIELAYFDTSSGRFKIAKTDPIPVSVSQTRVVTAMDAEGNALPVSNSSAVETWTKGIAYNYEDPDALKTQFTGFALLRSPIWRTSVIVPPLLYLLIFIATLVVRKRHADPQAVRARKAYTRLQAELKSALQKHSDDRQTDHILEALRHYIGARLKIPNDGTIVYGDIHDILKGMGVSDTLLKNVKSIFDACEAGRYSGTAAGNPADLSEKLLETANQLEAYFK